MMKSISKTFFEEFKTKRFRDKRGYIEIGCENDSFTIKKSFSRVNVFRGLHIQIPPFSQSKYIWVQEGEIIDLCLNLNYESEGFGEYKLITITPKNGVFHIPPYMAHGYFSTKPSKFNYICTGRYSSKHEISIKPSNAIFKELGVKESLIMSDKDSEGMNMNNSIKKFRDIRW
jgi:dTDP-4-dehydrorhamnose 3,5-epimerase